MNYETVERVKRGLNDPALGPETIALIPTSKCNLGCLYCRGGRNFEERREFRVEDELTLKEIEQLLSEARELGVKEINLGGMIGEPFLRKDIIPVIAMIKQFGFVGSATTNGSLLTAETAAVLTQERWDLLAISFDSAFADIQHRLRPALSREPYHKSILQFLDRLAMLHSSVRVTLNMVITNVNYKELPGMLELAGRYRQIEAVNVLRMLPSGSCYYDSLQLAPEQKKEFKEMVSDFHAHGKLACAPDWLGGNNEGHSPGPGNGFAFLKRIWHPARKRCFTNYYILCIDANGSIVKCPQYQEEIPGLNIKTKNLKELWQKHHLGVRKRLAYAASCFSSCCTILKEQNKKIERALTHDKYYV